MQKVITWWERGLVAALYLSIALLGIGRLDFFLVGGGISAWSVSRTTFFFWLIWKVMTRVSFGHYQLSAYKLAIPIPVLLFFTFATISLLPDFHNSGDYLYFFFASMHYLMIVDLFSDKKNLRLVYLLLALLPGIVAVRGIVHDPSILELSQMRRFGYPLPHPNIAGYLFAVAIPLCLALAIGESGRLRKLSLLSCAAQLFALILTYSRGSWLGWLASMLFFGVTLKRMEIGAFVVVAGLLLSFAAPLRDRAFSLIRPQTDSSINDRMEAIEAGLKLGLKHPILGTGYGRGRLREGLRELYGGPTNNITRIAHTHNVYVELFATTGALGLGAFLWLLGQGLCQILSDAPRTKGAERVFQLGLAAAWIAFAITALWDVPLYHHDIRILFFTLLALIHLHHHEYALPPSADELDKPNQV
jgi:O-antigen ligase